MADPSFVFTEHMAVVSNQLWAVTAMVGAALCGAVLLVIGIVALNPVSRSHLDRVSFRILVCALVANTVFGITNAIGGKFKGPTWACGFTIFLLQLTLELSSFLLFSIALNLQLVVVHRINGQKMEKFYIFGSILISLGVTVPPYAAKQYGWDPLVKDCWYSNANKKERLAWQIGTQLFWTMLTVVGEIVTALTVVTYMIRHQLQQNRRIKEDGTVPGVRSKGRSRSNSVVSNNDRVAHANVYKGIIFRICLYPLASAIINVTSVACVIRATTQGGVHTWTGYYVLLLSDFVYGGRAILYALLAATDPALLKAVRAFIHHSRGSSSLYPTNISSFGGKTTQIMSIPGTTRAGQHMTKDQGLAVNIELSTMVHSDDQGSTPGKDKGASVAHHGYIDEPLPSNKPDLEAAYDQVATGLQSSAWTYDGNERRNRLHEDMKQKRETALARDRERDDFKKQI